MFKDALINLRKENRMSQQELADKMKISRSAIGMWETGKREPDYETLEFIGDIFNVDIDYILGKTTIKRKCNLGYLKEDYALDINLRKLSALDKEIDKKFISIYVDLSDKQKELLLSMAEQMRKE